MMTLSSAQTVPTAGTRVSTNSAPPTQQHSAAEETAIRPFRVNLPEGDLVDLCRRIAATHWPDKALTRPP